MTVTLPAARVGLCVWALAAIAGGLPGQETFDKNDFLSRKKWYVTFTFGLKGKGEATRTKDSDHWTTTWNIYREVSGTFELDDVHQRGPRSSVLAPGERYQGRYISWDASTGLSEVNYLVADSVEHESVTHGEAGAETMVSGATTFAGAGTTQIGRSKELKCDLQDMVFDLDLTDLRGWNREGVLTPLKLTGEYHDFTPVTKVRNDIVYPPGDFGIFGILPDVEPLRPQLAARKLALVKDRITFSVSVPVEKLPYFPAHRGSIPGGAEKFNNGTTAGGPPLQLSLDVTISPGPPSRAQLILEAPDYDTWRPQCSNSEDKPGNQFKLAWRVEEEGGDSAQPPEVRRVVFSLRNTSKEPGVCMNYPLQPKTPADFDLKFERAATSRAGYVVAADGQKLTLSEAMVSAGKGNIAVDCFDAGGWSELSATAELADGRTLTGHLKGSPALIRLLIPKRMGGSYIADAWKAEKGVTAGDDDDSEKLPAAGKAAGDGFTLYEEYRGFIENGKYLEGDPKKIDFFVRNYIGGDARPGIDLFANLTGAEVHDRLRDAEFDAKGRVMNANHQRGPHRKDQHAVFLRTEAGLQGAEARFTTVSVRGRPGLCTGIFVQPREAETTVTTSENLPASELVFAYDRAVVHELLHAVGVEHHGEGDGRMSFHFMFGDDPRNTTRKPFFYAGSIFSLKNIVPITDEATGRSLATVLEPDLLLARENLRPLLFDSFVAMVKGMIPKDPVTPRSDREVQEIVEELAQQFLNSMLGHKEWFVGVEHGQCSGDEGCVTRYYFAKLYQKKGVLGAYYYISDKQTERAGLGLCRARKGTGINAPGRKPQPRYGDSKPGWGECANWIVFNDAATNEPAPKP